MDTDALEAFVESYGYVMTAALEKRVTFWQETLDTYRNARLTERWEIEMCEDQVKTWSETLNRWRDITD